jgi:hypothetical protein
VARGTCGRTKPRRRAGRGPCRVHTRAAHAAAPRPRVGSHLFAGARRLGRGPGRSDGRKERAARVGGVGDGRVDRYLWISLGAERAVPSGSSGGDVSLRFAVVVEEPMTFPASDGSPLWDSFSDISTGRFETRGGCAVEGF